MKLTIYQLCIVFACATWCSCSNAQVLSDKAGFSWDFTPNGAVNEGTEDAFDGAYQLFVGSNEYSGGGVTSRDGMLVFGKQQVGDVTVSRHVILIEDPPGVFYADHFENRTAGKIQVSPVISSDFGEAAISQTKANESGGLISMLHPHDAPRPHLVHFFGSEQDEYLPTLTGSGDTYQFVFPPFALQPGESKTIGYFSAQRRAGASQALLKEEEVYSKAIVYVSALGDFSFPGGFGGGIYNTGKITLTKPAKMDFVSTGKNDKVYGKLLVDKFNLETSIGSRSYTTDQVVNIIAAEDGNFSIVCNDGSILKGKLSPSKIKFELSDGLEGEIESRELALIVPKLNTSKPKEKENWKNGMWFEFSKPVFVFTSGERLTAEFTQSTIEIHSEVGKIKLPTEQLVSIKNPKKPGSPSMFLTKDGQTFSGQFYDPFEIKIFDGSTKTISPKNLSSIFFSESNRIPGRKAADRPLLKLSGKDFLYVKLLVDETPLEFRTAFGTRKMNPDQIYSLKIKRGLKQSMDIVLWDGSNLQGELTSEFLQAEILGVRMQIPASQIEEFNNPMALPPKAIREKYIKLIHQLGSRKYEERADAIKTLTPEKDKLRGLFKSQLDKVSVEAKAQIWQLLPPDDRPKTPKGEKPNVKRVGPAPGDDPPK